MGLSARLHMGTVPIPLDKIPERSVHLNDVSKIARVTKRTCKLEPGPKSKNAQEPGAKNGRVVEGIVIKKATLRPPELTPAEVNKKVLGALQVGEGFEAPVKQFQRWKNAITRNHALTKQQWGETRRFSLNNGINLEGKKNGKIFRVVRVK